MNETQLINTFVNAWARIEGFFDQRKFPTLSQRLHNPCSVDHWLNRAGSPYPELYGRVEFPTDEAGWAAAKSQARRNIVKRQFTFIQFFAGIPSVYRGACIRDDMKACSPADYARRVAVVFPGLPSINTVIASLVTK